MTSIAETIHQQDPHAIAEILQNKLQQLDEQGIEVEAETIDSNLELQIRTNSAIDRQKLLTLVRSELQNLPIESVTKFRVHCWRNDSEMRELRLLWTEQFMLEHLQNFNQDLANSDSPSSAKSLRSTETQLSKSSVLHQAINQIAPHHPKAKSHLLEVQQMMTKGGSNVSDEMPSLASSPSSTLRKKNDLSNISSYGQLLILGISIVLFGVGLGALVKAVTIKQSIPETAAQTSTSAPIIEPQQSQPPTVTSAAPEPAVIPSVATTQGNLVTLEKFNLVKNGMSVAQVEAIFGIAGKVIAENEDEESVGMVYSWKNPQGSNAIIEFKNGKVVAKAQAGL